jgi:hypothetical protein
MDLPLSLRRTRRAFLFVFFLAAAWTSPVQAEGKVPWARIVVIGASVSHGFTGAEPFGGPKTKELALDRYLDAALLAPHEPPRNLANAMFFMLPDDMGHTQIRQALTNDPTLVIGIDFLFWFCYGHGETDQDRQDHFEKGLTLLEAVECPLIIGDIPDASAAVNRMLSPREVPSPKARAAANRRLKEWAAQRKQVTVVPLAEFMRLVAGNKALTVHGHAFADSTTLNLLLQGDRLHPRRRGCAVLAVSILDAFVAGQPGLDASQVRWDPEEVLREAGSLQVQSAEPAERGPGFKP